MEMDKSVKIPLLKGPENYEDWRDNVLQVLKREYKAWKIIHGEFPYPRHTDRISSTRMTPAILGANGTVTTPPQVSTVSTEHTKSLEDRIDDWNEANLSAESYITMYCEQSIKHLLKYLRNTINVGITYDFSDADPRSQGMGLEGYADSSYADDVASRRSHSGQVFTVGFNHTGPVSWQSGLQKLVTLSSCEAELVQLSLATQESLWIQRLLTSLNYKGPDLQPLLLHEDNRAAIQLAENPEFHKRVKHIDVKHLFCRQHQASGEISVVYIQTDLQKADGFTKTLEKGKHLVFLQQLGMKDSSRS